MAKKQFDNVVSSITRPQQRVSSMSELLEDEKILSEKIDQSMVGVGSLKEEEKKENITSEYSVNSSRNCRNLVKENTESVIRDGFSMPSNDYHLIALLSRKAGFLGHSVNKSEILRAGLQFLSKLSDDDFSSALNGVVKIKPGRKVSWLIIRYKWYYHLYLIIYLVVLRNKA